MASERMRTKIVKKKALVMSYDRALQLIQLIKNRECLWNKFHPTATNEAIVANAWKEVSIKMRLPVDFLQRKWKSLQGTFRHVRAVHEQIIATASDPNSVRKPCWFAYEAMLFLNQVSSSLIKARSNKQQSISCKIGEVEANSTHEEHGEYDEEEPDVSGDETEIDKKRTFPMSHDRTLQLIQLIKNRECLWNKFHPVYDSQTHVANAWKDVSTKMRLPVDFLQRKWKSLQGSFRSIKSLRGKSITGDKSVRQRSWFAYEAMMFLDQAIVPRLKRVSAEAISTQEEIAENGKEVSDILPIETSIDKRKTLPMSHGRTLQLIQLVRNRECLWNKCRPTGSNRSDIANAWKEVSMKMRLPVDFLQQKWKSLQGSFRAVRSIRTKNIAAASDANSVRKPCWFAYDAMLFLNQVNVSRVKARSTNQQSICNDADANSTRCLEEHVENDESVSDIFGNETVYADNLPMDTSKTETERASTYEEHVESDEEVTDIFANETNHDNKKKLRMSRDRTLQLIQLVRNRECLWKCRATSINRSQIAKAWKEVSVKMGLPVDFLQWKWRSLHGAFRSVKSHRTKNVAAASAGAKSVRKPCWFAYEAMMFLNEAMVANVNDRSRKQESICKIGEVEANSIHNEHDETDEEVSDVFGNETIYADSITMDTSNTETEGASTYKEHVETNKEVSEGTRFASLLARKLDNMSPVRRKRIILKFEKQLLDEEEAQFMGKYGPL
ncbi:uncharacterized protein LOC118460247 isoform X2 [Anopheles albimanus]|uniref:uncharacterized protein LOC118460247 isoform X2 n=1 Tax=Anopheles albimanus TaxID=7167 RepID=UPI00163EB1D4|nr:uncharacterized protein LOC118460247 isoform X2 [Anopheles albimanus]